ncbi:MAG TPA: TetR/AcrR family transcriptional regulator [Yinghuangia sp.]|nr:TetR/AcrR family transcriptional regulator [Yinghuangia sp.]
MRADAQRNRQAIIAAARDIFGESGADAPLDEIARRAGVGIATLYRRFPQRDDLIRAVVLDTFQRIVEKAEAAMAEGTDAFDALRRFMHAALDIKIGATMPVLAGRVVFDEEVDKARLEAGNRLQPMLERAQEQGLVRPDIAFGDLTLMVMRLSRPLPAITRLVIDADIAHRHLDIYLDGLRAGGNNDRSELPGPVVTLADFSKLKEKLGGPRDIGDDGPHATGSDTPLGVSPDAGHGNGHHGERHGEHQGEQAT